MRPRCVVRSSAIVLIGATSALVATAWPVHAGATPGQKCAVAKQKAAVKKLGAKVKCAEKAILDGATAPDPACLVAAETKFDAAIAKAEAKGGCVRTGDGATIEGVVDTCVNDVLAAIPSTVLPTCQTAVLSCTCGNGVHVGSKATCGTSIDCSTARSSASAACSSNGGDGDCATVDCTDVCTSQPCS